MSYTIQPIPHGQFVIKVDGLSWYPTYLVRVSQFGSTYSSNPEQAKIYPDHETAQTDLERLVDYKKRIAEVTSPPAHKPFPR